MECAFCGADGAPVDGACNTCGRPFPKPASFPQQAPQPLWQPPPQQAAPQPVYTPPPAPQPVVLGKGWSKWEDLGGQITSSPGVSSWQKRRLDVFARGPDGAMC